MFDRRGSRKYLNAAERRGFLKAARKVRDREQRTFCLTLFYTGCRISEALNVTAERIDPSQKSIVFETLKRRRRGVFRDVPIPDTLAAQLGKLQTGAAPLTRVWPFSRATGYRLIKECMVTAGIRGAMASPKGLRHGFAVACISKNIPLPVVQKWLGHARMETTAIYLGVGGDDERRLARRLW